MRLASSSVLGHSLSVVSAVGFRLLGRVFTFGVNLLSAKWLHPQAYGVAHVSLCLLEQASVTLLKEGFRRAALRAPEDCAPHQGGTLPAADPRRCQVAALGCYVTLGVATALASFWCYFAGRWLPQGEARPVGVVCVVLVYLGILLQAIAETQFVHKVTVDPLVASRLETKALIGKTLAVPFTYAVLVTSVRSFKSAGKAHSKAFSLYAFAAGHLVYGFIWWWTCRQPKPEDRQSLQPDTARQSFLIKKNLWLAWNDALILPFCVLAIQKALLNEAERLALVLLFASTAWPSWALVSNLGSLVCRLIFSPIEEYAFVRFSQEQGNVRETITSPTIRREQTKNNNATSLRKRRSQVEESITAPQIEQPQIKPVVPPLESFFNLFTLQGSIGLAAVMFGRPLASAVLILLYGERWIALGTHVVLRTYCFHVFCMSLTGIAEAFLYATAPKRWLSVLKYANPAITVLGLLSTALFKRVTLPEHLLPVQEPRASTQAIQTVIWGANVTTLLRLAFFGIYFLTSILPASPRKQCWWKTAQGIRGNLLVFLVIGMGTILRWALRAGTEGGRPTHAILNVLLTSDLPQGVSWTLAWPGLRRQAFREILVGAACGCVTLAGGALILKVTKEV